MDRALRRTLIENFTVAKPCGIDWDTMTGDDKVRLCGQCDRNVHNISGMSEEQAALLIQKRNAERVCIYYRRNADGSIHIDNCPEMLKPVRNKIYAIIAGVLICTIVGVRYSAACSIAANYLLSGPFIVPIVSRSLESALYQYDPKLSAFNGHVWPWLAVAIAQVTSFIISILVFLAPINKERKRSFRRYLAGLLVTFGGPTLTHMVGTFMTNNFGGLGGGM